MRNVLAFLIINVVQVLLPNKIYAQAYPPEKNNKVFTDLWNISNLHKEYSYFSFFPQVYSKRGDLQSKILLEAQVAHSYNLYQGRERFSGYGQTTRLFITPIFNVRSYFDDPHSDENTSIKPPNLDTRVSLFHAIQNKKWKQNCNMIRGSNSAEWISYYQLDLGYEGNIFEEDLILSKEKMNRFNFDDGKFAQAYMKFSLSQNYYDHYNNLISFRAYGRYNFGLDGMLFKYNKELEYSFGRGEIGAVLQFQSNSRYLGRYRDRRTSCTAKGKIVRKSEADVARKAFWPFVYQLRLEPSYVIGNLVAFDTLAGLSKDYRFRGKASLNIQPINWRYIGFLLQYYYGRDYYNNRFSDITHQVKFALLFDIVPYKPRNISYLPE